MFSILYASSLAFASPEFEIVPAEQVLVAWDVTEEPEVRLEPATIEVRTPRQKRGRAMKIAGFTLFGLGSSISVLGDVVITGSTLMMTSCSWECPAGIYMAYGAAVKAPGMAIAGAGGGLVLGGYSLERPVSVAVTPWVTPEGGGLVASGVW